MFFVKFQKTWQNINKPSFVLWKQKHMGNSNRKCFKKKHAVELILEAMHNMDYDGLRPARAWDIC